MLCMMILISKEQFLEEHNRLSPANLQATLALLNRFKEEKKPLLKDTEWCLDKHRIPFMSWLSSVPESERKGGKRKKGKEEDAGLAYRNYPETHYEG